MGFAYADPDVLTDEQRAALAEHQRTVHQQPRELTLKALREEAKLSHADLATQLKWPVERIKKLESGDLDRVQLATLRRYIEALEARIEITAIRGEAYARLS